MSKNPDPYAVLGVAPGASGAEISHAFRAKVRALHPDVGDAESPPTAEAAVQLQQLLSAYELLRHRDRRHTGDGPPQATHSGVNHQGPVDIPVTYRHGPPQSRGKDLWAGPVRRHR